MAYFLRDPSKFSGFIRRFMMLSDCQFVCIRSKDSEIMTVYQRMRFLKNFKGPGHKTVDWI